MFTSFTWRDRLSSLLIRGCEVDAITHATSDENVESAIQLLQFAAEKDPTFLLKEVMALSASKMTPTALTMLYALAPDEFLKNEQNREHIAMILLDRTPAQLLSCAEMLRSKTFGRGLGSRPQKAIRRVMESWDAQTMEEFVKWQPRAFYALVRLVHPRYSGYRGEIIRALLDGEFVK